MAEPAVQVTPKPSPAIEQMRSDIAQEEKVYNSRAAALTEQQTRIGAEREKALAPLEESISKSIAAPYPERPHTELPTFKQKPVIDSKEYESLSYGLIAMALIGGAASKGKWLEVGASLNGALKGYLEGNKIVAEKRYADYEQSFRDAQAKEAQANREFEDILTNKKLRISDQINQYRIVAAKYDRQDALVAVQSRDLTRMWQSLESHKTALGRLEVQKENADNIIQLRREQGGGGSASGDPTKTGEEYLQSLPAGERELIKKVATYQINPNSLSTRGGHREKILAEAAQYSPSYNQMNYATMQKAINDFGTGKQGNSVRAFNVALEHLDTLASAGKALQSNDAPLFNKIKNAWEQQTGQPGPTDFNAVKQLVADEVVKAIVGSGGGVHDREEAAKTISAVSSPEQLAGVIRRYKELFGGQIKGLEQQYKAATGLDNFQERYLTQKGREAAGHGAPAQRNSGNLTPPSGTPMTNARGWPLHHDARGNWAYVGPNNEIEEVGAGADQSIVITPRAR